MSEKQTLPMQFGKYHLIERIAKGGMAELFRAKLYGAGGFEKDLAIKKVLPSLASDQAFTQMFMDEAMISASLNHGNIVSVIDFGQLEEEYYLVMEYVDGVSLQSVIARSIEINDPIPPHLACWIALQICRGLDYAHRKMGADGHPLDIVHRDISPHNVLLSFEGEVKIVDFGIAKTAGRISSTKDGVIKGKAAYMSPEQLSGKPVDRRSDVFAAGIVFYEMLTNRLPFASATPQETMALITRGIYPKPQRINQKLDNKINPILQKALHRNPKRRFQTASEMASSLSVYLHSKGMHPDETALTELIPARLPDARPKTFPPTPTSAKHPQPKETNSTEAVSFSMLDLPAYKNEQSTQADKVTEYQPDELTSQVDAWMDRQPGTQPPVLYRSLITLFLKYRPWIIVVSFIFIVIALTLILSNRSETDPSDLKPAIPDDSETIVEKPSDSSIPEPQPIFPQTPTKAEPTPLPSQDKPSTTDLTAPAKESPKANRTQPVQKPPTKKKAYGFLQIDSKPGFNVYMGDKKLGKTPLKSIRLPAGSHTLRLTNPSSGITRHIRVRVEPNRTHRMYVNL